jgi:hypothetical protein
MRPILSHTKVHWHQSEHAEQDAVAVVSGLSMLLGLKLRSGAHDLPRNLGTVQRPCEEVNWSVLNAHFPDLQLRQFVDLQGSVTFFHDSEIMPCPQLQPGKRLLRGSVWQTQWLMQRLVRHTVAALSVHRPGPNTPSR